MRRNGEITIPWANGDHRFRLGAGELELLQEETDFGPYILAERMRTRQRAMRIMELDGTAVMVSLDGEIDPPPVLAPQCTLKEIGATLRLGLIGGGMKPGDALKLVKSYVENRPVEDNRAYAHLVLQAALYGAPEEQVGEQPAPDPEKEGSFPPSQTES